MITISAQVLAPSENTTLPDGIIGAKEYSVETTKNGIKVAASLSVDGKTLFFAIEAPTTGWVAIGLGSLRMDGAFMVFGYDDKGKVSVSEEAGKGHSHKPNEVKVLSSSMVREAEGTTVLEFSLPSGSLLQGASLKMIAAYGKSDNFKSFHSKYAKFEIPFSK